MKTLAYTLLFTLLASLGGAAKAQQSNLVPDQNPRYMESQQRYTKAVDSLTKNQSTTLQQTYKAFDWYQARVERRQQRREWRHQENLYNGFNNGNFNNGFFNNGFYNNGFWPGFYNPSPFRNNHLWNRPFRGNRWGSSIWFGF